MTQGNFLSYSATGIAQLLRTHSLAVPFYQRSYSWVAKEDSDFVTAQEIDKLQVVDFWADLSASFASKASYFMGTVVLAASSQDGDSRRLVIDGQQRLATTSLLIAAIRDRYRTGEMNEYASSTQQDYLGKFDRRAGGDLPKLILNTDDRDYFEKQIVRGEANEPSNYSQGLISEAYEYLSTNVSTFAESHGTAWREKLDELVEWLDTEAQIVAISVESEADAFLIFETLNDRGADLTVADLLKNFLFSQSAQRLDEVRDNWVATLTNLDIERVGNQRFTTFARHLLSSKYGRTREREVYARLKSIVVSPASSVEFSQELKDASRVYYAMLTSDSDYWSEYPSSVASAASVLAELNIEQYRPLVLAALTVFPKGEIERFMPALVSWVVRGLAGGTLGAGTAEAAFGEAARDIRAKKITTTEDVLSKSRVGDLVASDAAFERLFSVWRVMRGPLARYILRTLELQEKGEDQPELVVNEDVASVNLEHILPKNAKVADWPTFSADDQKAYVHRIGNHALLQTGPNGRIGNKGWAVKKPILDASSFKLTKKTATEPDWTASSIETRQQYLATLAVLAWPREPRAEN